uniref:Uncharacterized protein n=1 Tax=Ciona savignyi TaxID=51511 RepID=H2Z017_CIOSA
MDLNGNQSLVLYSCLFIALGLLLMIVIATLVILKRKRTSLSRSSSYTGGRPIRRYSSAPRSGGMHDDFCIIPTKPPTMGDAPPYAFQPNYPTVLDQNHHPCNYPTKQCDSDQYQQRGYANEEKNDKTYHVVLCSRDDHSVCYHGNSMSRAKQPYQAEPGYHAMNSPTRNKQNYDGRPPPNAAPNYDGTFVSGRSGSPCHKHVTFADGKVIVTSEYDSGFEGESVHANSVNNDQLSDVNRDGSEYSDAGCSVASVSAAGEMEKFNTNEIKQKKYLHNGDTEIYRST